MLDAKASHGFRRAPLVIRKVERKGEKENY